MDFSSATIFKNSQLDQHLYFLNYVSSFQVQLEEKNVIIGSLRSEGQDSLILRYGPDADSEFQFISEAERGY